MLVAAFMGVKLTREFSGMTKELRARADAAVFTDLRLSEVPDGTYGGTCDWGVISVQTQVTVEDGNITAIDILKHSNGRGKPAEQITADVLAAQTLQVDVVSGATYSSKAILTAIQNALAGR